MNQAILDELKVIGDMIKFCGDKWIFERSALCLRDFSGSVGGDIWAPAYVVKSGKGEGFVAYGMPCEVAIFLCIARNYWDVILALIETGMEISELTEIMKLFGDKPEDLRPDNHIIRKSLDLFEPDNLP